MDGVRGMEQGLEGETGKGLGLQTHRIPDLEKHPVCTCQVPGVSMWPFTASSENITIPLAKEKMSRLEVRQRSHLKVRLPRFIDSKLPSPLSCPTFYTALRKKTTQCGGGVKRTPTLPVNWAYTSRVRMNRGKNLPSTQGE